MAAAGRTFADAGVAAIYLVHGTFTGNDPLGLLTELSRYAPAVAERLRRWLKGAVNFVLGETGNYIPSFAERMERGLSAGAGRPLPIRLFNWSGQNNHIARADGAVRLIDELARIAVSQISPLVPSPWRGELGRGDDVEEKPPRIQIWTHSHGGNALALATNLLGADEESRAEFFHAARSFYRRPSGQVDLPAWGRVEQLLRDELQPTRKISLDIVNFGTPIRYGWEAGGYSKLLHITSHRADESRHEHLVRWPPRFLKHLFGADGDLIHQLGIAGTNLPPLPLAWRTFRADWRLDKFLERDLSPPKIWHRLRQGMRVPHDGTTLLVDYADPDWFFLSHFFGHAPYTRSRWLPLHCECIAREFYGMA